MLNSIAGEYSATSVKTTDKYPADPSHILQSIVDKIVEQLSAGNVDSFIGSLTFWFVSTGV